MIIGIRLIIWIEQIISHTANLIDSLWNSASKYMAMKQWIQFICFTRLKCKCKACLISTASRTTKIKYNSTNFISMNNCIRFTVMQSINREKKNWMLNDLNGKQANKTNSMYICLIWLANKMRCKNTYTTYPSEHDGIPTDTFMPFDCECEFISLIFRKISFSDFGAFILTEPRYVTPANSVQSWSISDTRTNSKLNKNIQRIKWFVFSMQRIKIQ